MPDDYFNINLKDPKVISTIFGLPLAQVDIPSEVWSQYPLIAIGVILVGWLARQWVINEREWRTFTTQQVADKEAALLRTLQLIQANNENLHKILLDGQAEQLRLQREGLKETFDAELERVLDLLANASRPAETPRIQPQPNTRGGGVRANEQA
jgi:hypothetical protein